MTEILSEVIGYEDGLLILSTLLMVYIRRYISARRAAQIMLAGGSVWEDCPIRICASRYHM